MTAIFEVLILVVFFVSAFAFGGGGGGDLGVDFFSSLRFADIACEPGGRHVCSIVTVKAVIRWASLQHAPSLYIDAQT